MKKFICVILCLSMLTGLACSCSRSDGEKLKSSTVAASAEPGSGVNNSLASTAQSEQSSAATQVSTILCGEPLAPDYISYFPMSTAAQPEPTLIHSKAELDSYIKKYFSDSDEVSSALSKYQANYFNSFDVALMCFTDPSGSISHCVTGTRINGGELTVEVETRVPAVGDCAMAYWVIAVSCGKGLSSVAVKETEKRASVSTTLSPKTDITLEITELHGDYFNATLPWPSPMKYKVMGKIDDKYCVGDYVSVTYRESDMLSTGESSFTITALSVAPSDFKLNPNVAYKPVIYLYPKAETEVCVRLDYCGALTHTYPVYDGGWRVTAQPDGTLKDGDGEYPYLFWEGESNTKYDMSRGFCVKGSETEDFLRAKLAYMGLNDAETQDFLNFWLPRMVNNEYNIICFQGDAYTDSAKLTVSPEPDSVIRVFMAFTPSAEYVAIAPQRLERGERRGFTVVEWGGAMPS